MQYSLMVHGDDDRLHHVDATSAEDAMRQLFVRSSGGPFRATFLTTDEADGFKATRATRFLATHRRRESADGGHTRPEVARGVRR